MVDTSAMVSGIWGQLVKYYKVDMLEPDLVVGLQRGEERSRCSGDPAVLRRRARDASVHPNVVATSVDQRSEQRERVMAAYFAGDLQRFRVKPTVFMPTLPPLFDLHELDRLLVGLSDGAGGFSGLGYLEYVPEDQGLRLISPVAEAPKALRLGSVRLEDSFRVRRVDLRNLFGTE